MATANVEIKVDTRAFRAAVQRLVDAAEQIKEALVGYPPLEWNPRTVPWLVADPDLMEWIRRQGFDPKQVVGFTLWNREATVATFEIRLEDRGGNLFLDPRRRHEACTVDRIVLLWGDAPPYRHPWRSLLEKA